MKGILQGILNVLIRELIFTQPTADGTIPPNLIPPKKVIPQPDDQPNITPPPRVIYVPVGGGNSKPDVIYVPSLPAPPTVPPRRLPKEADGQSPTKTPKKHSISIKTALYDEIHGELLTFPLTQKKAVFTRYELDGFAQKMRATLELGANAYGIWLANERGDEIDDGVPAPKTYDGTALVTPSNLMGLSGEVGFIYGIGPLTTLASAYQVSRVNARQPVTGYVPLIIEFNSKAIPDPNPSFLGSPGFMISGGLEGIKKVLGVEDFNWLLNAKPEEILKGYGLMQFAKGGDAEDFEEKIESAIKNGTFSQLIASIGETTNGNKLKIKSIPRLIGLLSSAAFFRAGYHRLPQEYPEYLTKDKAGLTTGKKGSTPPPRKQIQMGDMLEIQDWQNRQLDALFGEWSTTISIKSPDGKEEEEIHLPNLAEAIGELFSLVFNINLLSEHQTQMQIKALSELIKLFNQDLLTHDHVVAISKFLGYNGETKTEEVPLPFNPKADDLLGFQKPSKHKVLRWKNVDRAILKEDLVTLGVNAAKAASAVWRKYRPGEPLPGEKIKEKREEAKKLADEQWDKWIKDNNLPTGYEKLDQKPRPIIDNIPIAESQDDA